MHSRFVHSALVAILLAGIVAGTIDIGAAALISWRSPVFIAKIIAGGLLGKAALAGGYETAAMGVALQWAMSWIIAALYVAASRMLPVLAQRWEIFGILYGVPVYFVMTYVVVPLSAWQRWPTFSLQPFIENLMAMMLFGLIVASFARSRPEIA
jgi:uncharacterized membrane protein YagU involved in acid resistance